MPVYVKRGVFIKQSDSRIHIPAAFCICPLPPSDLAWGNVEVGKNKEKGKGGEDGQELSA